MSVGTATTMMIIGRYTDSMQTARLKALGYGPLSVAYCLVSYAITESISYTYIYTQSDSVPSQTNANTTIVNGRTRR